MSRKVFTPDEILTAEDVNSYLMDQTVMNFAGTAARGSAILTPSEGMVSYLQDSNILSIYDGSNWKASLSTTGSVLQVVNVTRTTSALINTTSFVTTGLEASITPKSTSSKILILLNADVDTGSGGRVGNPTIYRGGAGGTNLAGANGMATITVGGTSMLTVFHLNFLDSPATTSSTTYTLMAKTTGTQAFIATFASMTLMEIAG